MLYTFEGKLAQVFDLKTGNRKSDGQPWERIEFIVNVTENGKEVPKYVSTFVNASKITKSLIGQTCSVTAMVESREYNGRWSTQLKGLNTTFPNMYNDERPDPLPDPIPEEPEPSDLPF